VTFSGLIVALIDVAAAVALLVTYFQRHQRRDLIVPFFGLNVGVLAVARVLSGTEVAIGFGLGLFGVLSIIRLRSSEITQREVAYYFASLAMGLIGGLASQEIALPAGLIVVVWLAVWMVDHPRLLPHSRHQVVRLDRAIADEAQLRYELRRLLGGKVTAVNVLNLDLVNDTTRVDVRFRRAPTPVNRSAGGETTE